MACMECAPKVNYRKVGVCWQMKEEPVVQKVWRYDEREIAAYSRDRVEQELLALFLPLKAKGLRLELSYEDSLVETVSIDSVADMQAALTAFVEESNLAFRTLYVRECMKPDVEVRCSKMQKERTPPKKKKLKVSHCMLFP